MGADPMSSTTAPQPVIPRPMATVPSATGSESSVPREQASQREADGHPDDDDRRNVPADPAYGEVRQGDTGALGRSGGQSGRWSVGRGHVSLQPGQPPRRSSVRLRDGGTHGPTPA